MRASGAFVLVVLGAGLLLHAAGCGGSANDVGDGKGRDTSPTEPAGSSGASGSAGATGGSTGSGGSSGSSGSSGTSGAVPAADAGADAPAANCVPPGYAGNEKKIGAYCDKDVSCPFQLDPFLICTYGHDDSGNHLFCTAPCSNDAECGSGAYCMKDPKGSGCVPTQCGGMPGT